MNSKDPNAVRPSREELDSMYWNTPGDSGSSCEAIYNRGRLDAINEGSNLRTKELAELHAENAMLRAQLAEAQAALNACIDYIESEHLEIQPPIPPDEPTDRDWRVTLLVEKARAVLKGIP